MQRYCLERVKYPPDSILYLKVTFSLGQAVTEKNVSISLTADR
jgi:hypothetical protein